MPKVSEQHRNERRALILERARGSFARHGYHGATVAVLEQDIGLSRGAIFGYFANKLALFEALAEHDRQRIGRIWLEQGFEAVVRDVAQEDADWIGVYLEVLRLLRTDPELRERWDHLGGDVEVRIRERYAGLQASGEIRGDLPVEQVLQFLGVVIDGLAAQHGAGFPIDVEGTLALVRAAVSPASSGPAARR